MANRPIKEWKSGSVDSPRIEFEGHEGAWIAFEVEAL